MSHSRWMAEEVVELCLELPSSRGMAEAPSWAEAAVAYPWRVVGLEAARILSLSLRQHGLEEVLEGAGIFRLG